MATCLEYVNKVYYYKIQKKILLLLLLFQCTVLQGIDHTMMIRAAFKIVLW